MRVLVRRDVVLHTRHVPQKKSQPVRNADEIDLPILIMKVMIKLKYVVIDAFVVDVRRV